MIEALTEAIGDLPGAVVRVDCSEPPCLAVFEGLSQQEVEAVVARHLGAPHVPGSVSEAAFGERRVRMAPLSGEPPADPAAWRRLGSRRRDFVVELSEEAAP